MDDGQGMEARRKQRTLSATAAVEGIGYWSGRDVRVEFRPAEPQQGIVFVRSDLPGHPRIPALVANCVEMPRRTVLRCGGASVDMIEHVTAALAGMHVDNCEVWVDQPEMPGCDGSSRAFVEAIEQAGIVEQDAPRELFVVRQVTRLGNEECWIEARPAAGGKTVIQYELDYGSGSPIGRQSLEVTLSPRYFHVSLASSRTFLCSARPPPCSSRGWATDRLQRSVGLRRGRPDRQRLALSRRVRASQDTRYGRRFCPGRLRSGRALCRVPQRTSPQRRVGAGDR